jgi:hypothetical protein
MYSAGDALPAAYTERFRTQIHNERIVYPGAWNKLVVVIHEDDHDAMLDHALIQKPAALPNLTRALAHAGRDRGAVGVPVGGTGPGGAPSVLVAPPGIEPASEEIDRWADEGGHFAPEAPSVTDLGRVARAS